MDKINWKSKQGEMNKGKRNKRNATTQHTEIRKQKQTEHKTTETRNGPKRKKKKQWNI